MRAFALAGAVAAVGGEAPADEQLVSAMQIEIDVAGAIITAVLDDTPTANDFATLLPLTLTLQDYNATEKISDLPRKLNVEGAPAGFDPQPGDLAYYAPWGNIAVFYRDFGYSRGLVKLGTIVAGGNALKAPGSVKATIRPGT